MNRLLMVLSASLILIACFRSQPTGINNATGTDESSFHASGFRLESFGEIRRLTVIDPWQDAEAQQFTYYLVPRDTEVPDSLNHSHVIRVPVNRMICMSTTHIAMMNALNASSLIAGISGTDLVYDEGLRKAISSGLVKEVGYEATLDRELIVSLKPDLLMAYGIGALSVEFLRKLSEAGIVVLFNADYLEEHPLARCEWIKVFGALTGKEREADSIFNSVTQNYMNLVDTVRKLQNDSPAVLLGAAWEDVWYVSPVNSFAARFICDAGGRYLFSDLNSRSSVPYSTEAVYRRAAEAEVWLNPGNASSLDDVAASDYRMTGLPVFRNAGIYNNNARIIQGGGNDYWESGVVRPDIVLKDLVSILHPECVPGYIPFYYTKLR